VGKYALRPDKALALVAPIKNPPQPNTYTKGIFRIARVLSQEYAKESFMGIL
jgi:hypothetical protein